MPLTRRLKTLWLAAALCCAAGAVAHADDGRFEIRNAWVEPVGEQWQLHARLDVGLSAAAGQALDEGVPLTLRLEAEAHTERRFLPDEKVASLSQQWLLEYEPIADRYVITQRDSGHQTTHGSRTEALAALGRIDALPLADASLLRPGRRFEVSVRASVEIGGMPDAVKLLLFWREWSRTTEWYVWSVRP